MRLRDLDQSGLDSIMRRISDLETATPLRNASVTAGRVRIGGTAVLLVDSSGGVVIHGSLNGDGTITWTGPFNLTGTETVNGGGKIVVAGSVPMTLGVTSDGRPGVEFAGGRMTSDGSRIAMSSGSSVVGAASTFASISNGDTVFLAQSTGPSILNLPTTTNAANIYADANGKLYRAV